MTTRRSRVWLVVSSALLLIILISALVAFQLTRYGREYTRLTRGTTREEVIKRFGTPGDVRKCDSRSSSWDGNSVDETSKTCVEEFWYFSKVSLEQWAIGFDKNGRVVSKAYLLSP